jgi:subtilisin family serine protease
MKATFLLTLLLLFAIVLAGGAGTSPAATRQPAFVSVIVTLRDQAAPRWAPGHTRPSRLSGLVRTLRTRAADAQRGVLTRLRTMAADGSVAHFRSFWIFNGLQVTGSPAAVKELAARPDVLSVHPDRTFTAPATVPAQAPEANLSLVQAPVLWERGYRGAGVVLASMDTGVDVGHPDLLGRWRGGSNSWFDPNGEHASPFDPSGHGTWTTGVMVGGDAGGTAVGVAPDAAWIAVKIFDDRGIATEADIHSGFQWLLDPDGDPSTADAPNVVNASWTFAAPGCDLAFEPDLEALRAAGILAVFAAGNAGPGAATSMSPANNPAALAVGATGNDDALMPVSSRGPSACADGRQVFPDLVAPGVDVRTADLFGGYRTVSGTSLAAPHVAGALALLLDAFPDLSPDEQVGALAAGLHDLGAEGPDDDYGQGRLDILASYEHLGAPPSPPPPPPPLPPPPPPPPPPTEPYLLLTVRGQAPDGIGPGDIAAAAADGLTVFADGASLGLGPKQIDAFAPVDADTILFSLARSGRLPGTGWVDDSDVVSVKLQPSGRAAAPRFRLVLDASDVGLEGLGEDIDALEVLPGGHILVSTDGRARVPGLRGRDEDLLELVPAAFGKNSRGRWRMYFDGSDVGLAGLGEDVDAVAVAEDGRLLLSTTGRFAVTGLTGGSGDVFACEPASLGSRTACVFDPALAFNGRGSGLAGADVDSIGIPTPLRGSGARF